MAHECAQCHYLVEVPPGERRPPWCPRCGADLKDKPFVVKEPVASGSSAVGNTLNASHSTGSPMLPAVEEKVQPMPVVPLKEPRTNHDFEPEFFTSKWHWQAIAWLLAIISVGIVAISAVQVINPPEGESVQERAYGAIGLFSMVALVSVYIGLGLAGQKFAVYPDRFVEWQMFKPTSFRWDQIRAVYQDVHPKWTRFRVETRLGRVVTIRGETKNHRQLGEMVSDLVAEQLLPNALKELEAGRDVRMGPLYVSRAGVTIEGELQPWHRIGVITFGLNQNPKRGSSLVSKMVHARIGDFAVEVGEIPNIRLFLELVRQLFPASVE